MENKIRYYFIISEIIINFNSFKKNNKNMEFFLTIKIVRDIIKLLILVNKENKHEKRTCRKVQKILFIKQK